MQVVLLFSFSRRRSTHNSGHFLAWVKNGTPERCSGNTKKPCIAGTAFRRTKMFVIIRSTAHFELINI